MDFFGLGGGEILLILVIIMIIWGPAKIPEIARLLGKTVYSFRKASQELTTAVNREIEETKKAAQAKPDAPAKIEPAGIATAVIEPGQPDVSIWAKQPGIVASAGPEPAKVEAPEAEAANTSAAAETNKNDPAPPGTDQGANI